MMIKFSYLILLSILIGGCSREPLPIQVNSELRFGQYIVSPPNNYWYFPREYPRNFKNSEDLFLLTFWEDKKFILTKDPNKIGVFFNLAISENTYNNYEDYYNGAKKWGIIHDRLPQEANELLTIENWSCKQTSAGVYGIECISLREHLVTIGVFGNDKNLVLSKIPLLKKTLESFKP